MEDESKETPPVEIIGGKPYDRDEVEMDHFEQGLAEGLAARAKRDKEKKRQKPVV